MPKTRIEMPLESFRAALIVAAPSTDIHKDDETLTVAAKGKTLYIARLLDNVTTLEGRGGGSSGRQHFNCQIKSRVLRDFAEHVNGDTLTIEHTGEGAELLLECGAAEFAFKAKSRGSYHPVAQDGIYTDVPQAMRRALTCMKRQTGFGEWLAFDARQDDGDETVWVVGSDTFRLAATRCHLLPLGSFMLHHADAAKVVRHVGEMAAMTRSYDEKTVTFTGDVAALSVPSEPLSYLDWRKAIPTEGETLTFLRDALSGAIDRALILADPEKAYKLDLLNTGFVASVCVSGPHGSSSETLDVLDKSGGDMDLVFNSRYLRNAVGLMPDESVTLKTKGYPYPVVFTAGEATYLIAQMARGTQP